MGVLNRPRGVRKLGQWAESLHEEGARAPLREVLYANERRIADVSSQRLANVVQTATEGGLAAEVRGGMAPIVAAKGAAKVAKTNTVDITPLKQALMLEQAASDGGWLVDLGERAGQTGDPLLRFVGHGRIVGPGESVPALPEFGLSDDLAKLVRDRRADQEAWLRTKHPKLPDTFLLLARGAGPICSIASMRHINDCGLGSFARRPPFGVLGLLEDRVDALTFLAPLIIWHPAGVALDVEPSPGEAFTGLL